MYSGMGVVLEEKTREDEERSNRYYKLHLVHRFYVYCMLLCLKCFNFANCNSHFCNCMYARSQCLELSIFCPIRWQ